jgi:hypothetical protein
MIRALCGGETAGAVTFDERRKNGIAAHQHAPRAGVIGWSHEDSMITRCCRSARSSVEWRDHARRKRGRPTKAATAPSFYTNGSELPFAAESAFSIVGHA